jgi:hypothetical protein
MHAETYLKLGSGRVMDHAFLLFDKIKEDQILSLLTYNAETVFASRRKSDTVDLQ